MEDQITIDDRPAQLARDPFSTLILLVCIAAAVALAIAGGVNFFRIPSGQKTLSNMDLVESVRDGKLPDYYVRMAYDEVKRLTKTPVDSKLQWMPNAAQNDLGLTIFGTVLDATGNKKEFKVQFGDEENRIVSSELQN